MKSLRSRTGLIIVGFTGHNSLGAPRALRSIVTYACPQIAIQSSRWAFIFRAVKCGLGRFSRDRMGWVSYSAPSGLNACQGSLASIFARSHAVAYTSFEVA